LSEGRWSNEAANLHRMLQANGTSIVQVAAELAECCRGKKVLCGEHDQHWLTTLFAAAGRNVPILIGDFDSFVSKLAQDVGRSADQLIANSDLDFSKNHRALTDAQSLAAMIRALTLRP